MTVAQPIGREDPFAHDKARSAARVADISVGLPHPVDGPYWRDKAEQRVQFLEEDGAVYGLLPHEEAELEQLKQLLEAK